MSIDIGPMEGRSPALFLGDMLEFCDRVLAYTAGVELEAFLADRMRFDATLRNVELIGEAASRIPEAVRAQAPEIAWRQIIGTRNRMAHAYLTLDAGTLWLIITDSIPRLRQQVQTFLVRLEAA